MSVDKANDRAAPVGRSGALAKLPKVVTRDPTIARIRGFITPQNVWCSTRGNEQVGSGERGKPNKIPQSDEAEEPWETERCLVSVWRKATVSRLFWQHGGYPLFA